MRYGHLKRYPGTKVVTKGCSADATRSGPANTEARKPDTREAVFSDSARVGYPEQATPWRQGASSVQERMGGRGRRSWGQGSLPGAEQDLTLTVVAGPAR